MSQEKKNELSKCLKQMQAFQALFLSYFDSDNEIEFQNFPNYFDEQNFIAMLCFISKFTKNYLRSSAFYDKFHKVLLYRELIVFWYSIISSDSYKNRHYPQYLQKEFQSISNEKFDIPDDYEQKRLICENDDF
ncbi:hypothetical protein M9Y10_042026 [Tritrichomonas musculus]|uniref:Uncharacterized protein n=1 Tax=Tritrichomonas musculus TaxID=1915356 RepID=A0ABR2K7T3_9EUKA